MKVGFIGLGKLWYIDTMSEYLPHLKEANEKRKNEYYRVRDSIEEKLCRICRTWKPANEYGRDKSTWDGLERRCRPCNSERALAYHHKNAKKINAYRRTEEYKQYFRPYQNEWLKKKRKESLDFRLRRNLRHRLYRALKGLRKEEKTMELVGLSIVDLKKYLESKFQPGMSWENYGQPGWEIDHIKPCALFDMTDEKQRKECFSYKNLQPMWGIENATKGHRYGGTK